MGRRQTFLLLLVLCVFASFVSAQSASVEFLDEWGEPTDWILEQGKALIRVIDPAANTSPGRDSVPVDFMTTNYMDSGFTELLETGDSTGVFEGEVAITTDYYLNYLDDGNLVLTSPDNDGSLDEVTATYPFAQATTTTATAGPLDVDFVDYSGSGTASYTLGETVRIRVRHKRRDLSYGLDVVYADLEASGGDFEAMALIETGSSTGVFEAVLPSEPFPGVPRYIGDRRVQAAPGETLTLRHWDNAQHERTDTASIAASSVRFLDARDGLPTDLVLDGSQAVVRVLDFAADASPTAIDTVSVTLSMQISGDSEPLTLRETGPGTGVFIGSMHMRVGYVYSGNQTFDSQPPGPSGQFDTATVTYGSLTDSAALTGSIARLLDEQGTEAVSFALGSVLRLQAEAAHEKGSADVDQTFVEVRSLTTGDVETLTIWETEARNWIFEGSISLVPGAAFPGDRRLQAQVGETVRITHGDANLYTSSRDEAQVVRSSIRFVDADGKPTSVLLEEDTARVEVLDLLSAGQQPPAATIESLEAQDLESLTLAEAGGSLGLFQGSIGMELTWGSPGDGILATAFGTTPMTQPDRVTARVNGVSGASAEALSVPGILEFVDDHGQPRELAPVGAMLRMRVLAPNENDNPYAEVIPVYLSSISDAEIVGLYETGPDTGIFEGTFPTSPTAYSAPPSSVLTVVPGDVVKASYSLGPYRHVVDYIAIESSVLEMLDGEGKPASTFLFTETIHLRLTATDANQNGYAADTVTAEVQAWRRNDSQPDFEHVTLTETGPNTGIFTGQLPTATFLHYENPWLENGVLDILDASPPFANPSTITATCHVVYSAAPVSATAEMKDSEMWLTDAQGEDATVFPIGSPIRVWMRRPASNTTPGADTDLVDVWTRTAYGDSEELTLTETGGDTGLFMASLPTGYGSPTSNDGVLRGQPESPFEARKASNGSIRSLAMGTLGQLSNQAPYANDDVLTTVEDTPRTHDVRANDLDNEGDPITVTSVDQPANGSAVLNGDGTVTYTPNANFNGWDTFTYTISAEGGTATATVYMDVTWVNDPPNAVDDTATTAENVPVVVPVLANDIEPDGELLSVNVWATWGGEATVNADKTITFTPSPDYDGEATITYGIADASSYDIAVVIITVTGDNDPPLAVNDVRSVNEDSFIGVPVLGNDSDPELQAISVTAVTQGAHGTVAIVHGGSQVNYTPNPNFFGTDTFTYTLSDSGGASSMATVTMTVNPMNDPPAVVNDSATTNEDTAVVIAVRANDTDLDGDTLTVTAVTQGAKGAATTNGSTVTYTPAANATGSDSFNYTIRDAGFIFRTATVTVTINPVNDPPVAVNDTGSSGEDTPIVISVLSNDSDPDLQALTLTAVTQGTSGSVSITGSQVTYTPAANFHGGDTFTYTVSDGSLSSVGTVTVTITTVNDDPVAQDDAAITPEDTPVTVSVLGNDTDADGDSLTVVSLTQPASGAASTNGTTVTYTPAANASGTWAFTYTVRDPAGSLDTGSVTVTVNPVNDPPVAGADGAATNEDTPVTIAVLGNDTDVDGALSVSAVTQGTSGSVSTNGTTVTYTPVANFFGADSFTYTVSDGNGGTATASVIISIASVNDAPITAPDSGATREGVPVIIAVLANDTDVEGNTLTVTAVGAPGALLAGGIVSYTPGANFTGTATFSYTVSDGQGGTTNGQVTVVVGEALERVAILATNSVALRTGSDVLSGDVIVNQAGAGPFLNGAELSLAGSVTTAANWDVEADSLTVAAGSLIGGDISYNQLTNGGTINGLQRSPLALPVFPVLPAFLTATPGTTTITVNTNGTRTLAPGSYLDLVVGRKGMVTFTGGTYHFRSITVDREAKLLFSAASQVRVQQKLSTKNLTTIGPATGASIDASSILFYVAGINGTTGALTATPKAVEIGTNNTVSINLYAPNGTTWLQDNSLATGAFLGKDVDLGANAQVTLDSAWQ
jgi:hypothetical protein